MLIASARAQALVIAALGLLVVVGVSPVQAQPAHPFRDCSNCPPMMVIPAGGYMMGSPASEAGRDSDEGPQRHIAIAHPFAIGRFEVTRGEYAAFAAATRHGTQADCTTETDQANGSWRNPGFAQQDNHPVVCVSWQDAQAYVQWLNTRVRGGGYRLPSEAEWEYAARANSADAYPWGSVDAEQICAYANGAAARVSHSASQCEDDAPYTAPVGAYAPNAFGLYDVIGNVWEWVQDCYEVSLNFVPANAGAFETRDCEDRVARGGGWNSGPEDLRVASRIGDLPMRRYAYVGFRVAKTMP